MASVLARISLLNYRSRLYKNIAGVCTEVVHTPQNPQPDIASSSLSRFLRRGKRLIEGFEHRLRSNRLLVQGLRRHNADQRAPIGGVDCDRRHQKLKLGFLGSAASEDEVVGGVARHPHRFVCLLRALNIEKILADVLHALLLDNHVLFEVLKPVVPRRSGSDDERSRKQETHRKKAQFAHRGSPVVVLQQRRTP